MKKIYLIIILGCFSFCLHSCTHTCTCVDANNKVRELEIDPAESCSDRSSPTLGECS